MKCVYTIPLCLYAAVASADTRMAFCVFPLALVPSFPRCWQGKTPDVAWCQQGPSGFALTGPAKAAFLLEAVANLRERLHAAGSELFVRRGRPEEACPMAALVVKPCA